MSSRKLVTLGNIGIFLSMTFFDSAAGRLVNITVDDTNPDPISGATFLYAPAPGHWHDGNGCDGCTARPDPSLTYDATWHDATFDPHSTLTEEQEVETASFQFHGSAFYVYGILSQSTTSPRSTEDLSFFIDGQLSGSFSYAPPNPGQSTYTYNVLLYANDSIPTGQHTFMLQNGRSGRTASLILLDYVIYTTGLEVPAGSAESTTSLMPETDATSLSSPSPSAPPSSASHTTTIIISAVLASVATLSVVIVLLLYIRRGRSQRHVVEADNGSSDRHSGEAVRPVPYTERSNTGLQTVPQMKGRAGPPVNRPSLRTTHDVSLDLSLPGTQVSSTYPSSSAWTSPREYAPPAYGSSSSAR